MWYSELNVVGTRAVRSLGSFVPLPQSISHRACCYTPLVWSYDMQGFLVKCEETFYKNNCSTPSFARIHFHSLYSSVKLLRMRRESRETPGVSDPDMHHGTCVTHVSWCMSGLLTSGFLWSRWWGKRSRHSRRMHNTQFHVSGKRPIETVS